jgi:hypothetical protein
MRPVTHECPECDRPMRGAHKCVCGWVDEPARAAAIAERDRFRCGFVDDGERCARRGVIARGPATLATFLCREHHAAVADTMAGAATMATRHRCAYVAGGLRCQNVGTVSRGVGAGVAFLCAAHHRCRTEVEAAGIVARSRAANDNAGH